MEIFLLQQKFGGKIIDIVSRDLRTPEEKDEALDAVKNTILEIFLIVVFGYDPCLSTFQFIIDIVFNLSLSFHGFPDQFALHFELGFFILPVKGLLHG